MSNDDEEYESNKAQAEAQLSGWNRLAALEDWRSSTNFPDRLEEHIENRRDRESEGVLSVEVEKIVRIVLCTGGPHCEVEWKEGCNPEVVCYGWFGKGEYRRPLTSDEQSALETICGDWDTLTYSESEYC